MPVKTAIKTSFVSSSWRVWKRAEGFLNYLAQLVTRASEHRIFQLAAFVAAVSSISGMSV
jgi:hypothetical protein